MRVQKWIVVGGVIWFIVCSWLLYWLAPTLSVHFEGDSLRYDALARSFFHISALPLEVLGYPLVIAGTYWLSGGQLWLLIVTQVCLSIGCMLILRRICYRLFDECAALMVTVLWALNLGFLIYSQLVLIEIVLTFLLLLFVERMVTYALCPTAWHSTYAALFGGLSILARPAALFFAPVCVLLFLVLPGRSLRTRCMHSVWFLMVFYAPVLVYMFGNYWWFGHYVLCPVMNVNLFKFFYPRLVLALTNAGIIVPAAWQQSIAHAVTLQLFDHAIQLQLIKIMMLAPWVSAKIWLINMAKSMLGLYSVDWRLYFGFLKTSHSFFALAGPLLQRVHGYVCGSASHLWLCMVGYYEVVYLCVQYSAVGVGCWVLGKRHWWLTLFAALFIGYFVGITGPDGSGRFRMMIEPWLLVLAAGGLSGLYIGMQRRRV